MEYYSSNYDSPFGKIVLISDGTNLCSLSFNGREDFINKDLDVFYKAKIWLDKYFSNKKPSFENISFSLNGSEFSLQVWEILSKIPYGKTKTYGEIAKEIANLRGKTKMSAQAVGSAISKNPVLIIIPCHRVIGANGNLTGYSGGLDLKKKLLEFEGVIF